MNTNSAAIKKIPVTKLRLGMHLHEFCGSWMDHPFRKTKFKLVNPADLTAIRRSAVTHVWIDTARGADLVERKSETPIETAHEAAVRIERALGETVQATAEPTTRVTLEDELARASAICNRARQAVTVMFGEARMGKAIETAELLPLVDAIANSVARNPGALVSLARLKNKDDYTYMHSVAVCGLMIALARRLGVDEPMVQEIALAGLLHDVGKAMVSLDVLNKPDKLTDAEFAHIKSHPQAGHALLLEGGSAGPVVLDVCLHHHEKVDGTGYPERLDESTLSLYARMGAVCDVYDAVTSDRPYKRGWDPATAVRKMYDWSSGHFDPQIFQAFVKTVGIYPVGSLVRLASGRLGVVAEVDNQTLLTPVVKTFYCTRRGARTALSRVDLGQPETTDRIVGWEDPAVWHFADLDELWAGPRAVAQQRRAAAAG